MSRFFPYKRVFLAFFLSLFAALSMNAADSSTSSEQANTDAASASATSPRAAAAVSKVAADSLYAGKHYAEAAEMYGLLADSIVSEELYYNQGNAEFKQKHYAKAVLAYERALRIAPDNKDAQYNIALVRTRLLDRFSKPSEMFFISWVRDWVTSHSVAHWTLLSFMWVVWFFLCLILYFMASRMWLRKTGFFAAAFCIVCFIATTVFAGVQRYRFVNNTDAVIMASEVQLYASPTASSKLVNTLHEGTTVTVIERQGKDWLQVELPDATEGWMQAKGYELVNKQ